MTPRDQQLKAATASWNARRIPRGVPITQQDPEAAQRRAEAFRAYADVEFGEAEALLRVERAA